MMTLEIGTALGYSCHFCAAAGCRTFVAKEMMFGMDGEFEYRECGVCKSLQIAEIPADISGYYPENYYSYSPPASEAREGFRRFLRNQLNRYYLYRTNVLGYLIHKLKRDPIPQHYTWFHRVKLDFSDSVLDVGCGSGALLLNMRTDGFKNLAGADPFVQKGIDYGGGLVIHKKELKGMEGAFDFIMFNHSIEHVGDVGEALREASRLLKPARFLMVRCPVADCDAWRKYGTNWVQLDAPRHLFIPSVEGLRVLAAKAGFELKSTMFDSTDFQYIGSEQYAKGIPLRDKRSYYENAVSLFPPEQIEGFRNQAKEVNETQRGDSACFFLYKH